MTVSTISPWDKGAHMDYLLRGLLVGLIFGVPAGAIGALTIQRALAGGFWPGFCTGLGSSAADVLYACVGVFGLTMVSDLLLAFQHPISLVGGLMIALLGVLILRRKGFGDAEQAGRPLSLPACFATAFAAAIANPSTILSFFAAFAVLGIGSNLTAAEGTFLIAGILLGTGCWWALLSALAARFRSRVTQKAGKILNLILGTLMLLFGIVMALQAF